MVQMKLQVKLLGNNAGQQNVKMFSQRLNELPFHTEHMQTPANLKIVCQGS